MTDDDFWWITSHEPYIHNSTNHENDDNEAEKENYNLNSANILFDITWVGVDEDHPCKFIFYPQFDRNHKVKSLLWKNKMTIIESICPPTHNPRT